MRLEHDCSRPGRQMPAGVNRLWYLWRCRVCGQSWSVTVWANGASQAGKVPGMFPNLRHWRWQRRALAALDAPSEVPHD